MKTGPWEKIPGAPAELQADSDPGSAFGVGNGA